MGRASMWLTGVRLTGRGGGLQSAGNGLELQHASQDNPSSLRHVPSRRLHGGALCPTLGAGFQQRKHSSVFFVSHFPLQPKQQLGVSTQQEAQRGLSQLSGDGAGGGGGGEG